MRSATLKLEKSGMLPVYFSASGSSVVWSPLFMGLSGKAVQTGTSPIREKRGQKIVDSRIEIFPESVWADYNAVSGARQGWQRILERWRVRAVVLSREQQPALIPVIRRDNRWRLVYQDDDGVVHIPPALRPYMKGLSRISP